jgi:hypothetical protein
LHLEGRADARLLHHLADSGTLAGLRRLALPPLWLGSEDGPVLAALLGALHRPALHFCGGLERVRWQTLAASSADLGMLAGLYLTGVGDADAQALASCPRLTGLTALGLSFSSALSGPALADLLASPLLARLRCLTLTGVPPLRAASLRSLTGSPHPVRLRELALTNRFLCAEGVTALAAWPGLARLDKLDLTSNNLGEALHPLADSPNLGPLTRLDLDGNRLPPALLATFRERLGWRVSA